MSPDAAHFLRLCAFVLCAFVLPAPLNAAQTVVTPSLSLTEEYRDNIFAEVSGRRADFLTTVAPGLSLTRSTETLGASLAGGVSQLVYLRNTENDALGYFLRGSANCTLSPRLSVNTDLSGTRDSSASSIDPVTFLVTSSRTLHQNYRLGERYRVSELISSSLNLGYGRDDYDNPNYLSTRHYLGNSTLEYDLGRYWSGVKLTQAVNVTRDATDRSQVDSLSATLGVSRDLSESWQVSLSGGGRYTRSRLQESGRTDWGTHEEAGGVGNLSVSYADQWRSANLTLSQDLISASGRSGATERTGGTLLLGARFARQFSGNLRASYARNWSGQAQFGGARIDERYWNLGGGLSYQLLDPPGDLALEASYSHNSTDYRISGAQMNQNVVFLRLTWQRASFR